MLLSDGHSLVVINKVLFLDAFCLFSPRLLPRHRPDVRMLVLVLMLALVLRVSEAWLVQRSGHVRVCCSAMGHSLVVVAKV